MPHKKSSKFNYSKALILFGVIVLVLLATLVALELTNTTHFFHDNSSKVAVTGSATSKDSSASTPTSDSTDTSPTASSGLNNNQTTSSSSTNQNVKQSEPTSTATLIAPTGTFANVYSASQTETMGSTCNTTPGATCVITFTNGSTVKSLPVKTADAGGGVLWQWVPKDIGLYPGTWSIEATAKLNTQSKTTSNGSLTLEIH